MTGKSCAKQAGANLFITIACACILLLASPAYAQQRPNILVIMSDDIGYWNLSTYNQGMMGYRTPNLDRIANEGTKFTDAYAENSCTAGRSAFITGQCPFRTGLLKVGLPGAKEGLSTKDPTIAEILRPLGYATGQFGKNHLGDQNEFLPTVHGFDEFFGNLYHLNAEEEPEHEDYPKDPEFRKKFGPRGVLHCFATDTDDTTVDPRFGAMGKQKCEDTGPLTRKRMETADGEFLKASMDFIERSHKAGKPFFVWFNTTLVHIWTHLPPEWKGKTGLGVYPDAMVELDSHVGRILKQLDDLGISKDTIVIFTTDNGAEVMTWPDGGTIPFRGEKNTTWEGGFRVPMLVRWPGHIRPGGVANDPISLQDWFPTLVAAAGVQEIKAKLLNGYSAGGRTYKVHLDGYDFLPYLTGQAANGPRKEFFYFTDDGDLSALRYGNYKLLFSVQRAHGLEVWQEQYTPLRLPILENLRSDPFERGDESIEYPRWRVDHAYLLLPAQGIVAQFLQSFKEFPPRAKPGSFTIDRALEALHQLPRGAN